MKKDYVHIAVVLDRSGSMGSILLPTISGYNEFLNSQKNQVGTAKFTLAQFDDIYEVVYNGVDVNDVPELNTSTFKPRNMTALYDAICKTIDDTGNYFSKLKESERPEKVVCVIITDGGENASREFTSSDVQSKINHQRDKYGWEFMFIGANQDAIATAKGFGISSSNALNYTANARGSDALYKGLGQKVANFRYSVSCGLESANEALMFDDEDIKKQKEAESK